MPILGVPSFERIGLHTRLISPFSRTILFAAVNNDHWTKRCPSARCEPRWKRSPSQRARMTREPTAFDKSWNDLMDCIESKRDALAKAARIEATHP